MLSGAVKICVLPGGDTVLWLDFNRTLQVLISAAPISTQGVTGRHRVVDVVGGIAILLCQVDCLLQASTGAVKIARIQALDAVSIKLFKGF